MPVRVIGVSTEVAVFLPQGAFPTTPPLEAFDGLSLFKPPAICTARTAFTPEGPPRGPEEAQGGVVHQRGIVFSVCMFVAEGSPPPTVARPLLLILADSSRKDILGGTTAKVRGLRAGRRGGRASEISTLTLNIPGGVPVSHVIRSGGPHR